MKYEWVIQYSCGCSTTVRVLRDQTRYCGTHGDGIQCKYRNRIPTHPEA